MPEQTYKIGEAAALLNLKSYVLRFWETEFPQLAPFRTEKGQRLYTDAHLVLLRRIRHLLHDRGLTIEGARKILNGERQSIHGGLPGVSNIPETIRVEESRNPKYIQPSMFAKEQENNDSFDEEYFDEHGSEQDNEFAALQEIRAMPEKIPDVASNNHRSREIASNINATAQGNEQKALLRFVINELKEIKSLLD